MRGLVPCLIAGTIAIAGCGADGDSSSSAPKQQNVTASGTTGAPAAVSAKGRATPASLCTAEGKGQPKKQCVAGLTKLGKGKAANPHAACKGLSKKKTKGVRGKSPYAVCVAAAAKLMASKSPSSGGGNGAADSDSSSSDSSSADDSTDASAGSSATGTEADPVCRDASGNTVPFDSEDVEECDPPASAGDSSSADDSSSSSDSSSDDSS